jgi:hypothetical protein
MQEYVGIELHRRRSVIVRMTPAGEVLTPSGSTTTRWRSASPSRPPVRTEARECFIHSRRNSRQWGIDMGRGLQR